MLDRGAKIRRFRSLARRQTLEEFEPAFFLGDKPLPFHIVTLDLMAVPVGNLAFFPRFGKFSKSGTIFNFILANFLFTGLELSSQICFKKRKQFIVRSAAFDELEMGYNLWI